MKIDVRTKESRNIWTNPAILLDHSEIEQSYEKFLNDTMQRYDPKRAELGVLRSQRSVVEFLRKVGLFDQALRTGSSASDHLSTSSSDTSSLTTSVISSSSVSSKNSLGRPVRSCTLTTTSAKAVLPTTANVSEPKKKVKAKKSPLRGGKMESSGGKKAVDESNNSAKKSNNPKLSTTTANSSTKNESVTVYQQQLLIKKLNDAVKCSEEENKK